MIVLLGGSGYFGEAFAEALSAREIPFVAPRRSERDYTRFDGLLEILRDTGAEFLINAAGFTGKPNVDACEIRRDETIIGNVVLPQTIGHACQAAGVPWAHVSSGCIYNGARLRDDAGERIVTDLSTAEICGRLASEPDRFSGFSEEDEPNFSFARPPCSFYSGTKALGELVLREFDNVYIVRPRIPFDEVDGPRNFLSKLLRYPKVYDNANSISHRRDYVSAVIDLWVKRAPFGIYNVTNPGFVTSRAVVARMKEVLKLEREFEFWEDDEQFYREAAKARRSNCLLDSGRLIRAGVSMRPVEEALDDALTHWVSEGGGR